jgi:hypothetical protein
MRLTSYAVREADPARWLHRRRKESIVTRLRASVLLGVLAAGLAAFLALIPARADRSDAEARAAATTATTVTAIFAKTSDWGSGFVGRFTIANTGSAPVDGWTLEFDLAAGQSIVNAWNTRVRSTGQHQVLTPESWTRSIAAGGRAEIGFQGASPGPFAGPLNCRIDGAPCTGGPTAAPAGGPATTTTSQPVTTTTEPPTTTTSTTTTTTTTTTPTTTTAPAPKPGGAGTPPGVPPGSATGSATGSGTATGSGAAAGSGARPPGFVPYVDMTLSSDSVAGMLRASGVKRYTLAFVVSGAPCQASWGGYYGLDDPVIAQRIAALQAAGGSAIVSFGGAINQELARTCTTADALATQYQAVIDRYGVRDLDFDIEGADQTDSASLERRFRAIAKVQAAGLAAGRPVRVSLTLPVMPSGLTEAGLGVVRSALANGVDVGTVNVMAMDYFDPALAPYAGRMGEYAIQAATAVQGQLATVYPSRSAAELWRMVGVTPMLGINDDPDEVFTTADAAKLTTFAQQRGLGRLSMWSINRDKPCGRPTTRTENTCSGLPDPAWAFSHAFLRFGS